VTSLLFEDRLSRLRIVAIAAAGLTFGLGSTLIALQPPGLSFVAASSLNVFLALTAGWSVMAVGLVCWTWSRDRNLGLLLFLVGCAWFVRGWTNPGTGSSILFTTGLVLSAAPAALVGQAMLQIPAGRRLDLGTRLVITGAYLADVVLVGLVPTILYAPAAAGCFKCPHNLLALGSDLALAAAIGRVGLALAVASILATIVLLGDRAIRATQPARRASLPIIVPGIAFLTLTAIGAINGLARGALGLDGVAERVWQAQAIVLVALSAGVALGWVRAGRIRSRVARLVVELATSPGGAGLRDRLAEVFADPDLQLGYRIADGRLVDHAGRSIVLERNGTRMITSLVRDGREVAVLEHRPGLEDDPAQMRELVNAARLGLENERLQALAQARLAEVRKSRMEIVEAGDEERRRLERDLHDGAQQRLVSLSIALRILRRRLDADAIAEAGAQSANTELLDQADAELRATLVDVRDVAHGIYPAVLAEEGLAAGVESLVEGSMTQITVDAVPPDRFDSPIEVACYLVVAEGTRQGTGHHAHVDIRRAAGNLVVDVEHDGGQSAVATDLEDRIGALNGTILVRKSHDGRVLIHAEIPCAS